MALPADMREDLYEERAEWLESLGSSPADVIEDEDGEFILVENESGNPGEEDYSVDTIKVRVPHHLQVFNINQ